MKVMYLIIWMIVVLSFGVTTTSAEKTLSEGCVDCDSVSSELSKMNDSILRSNKNRSKKLVEKVQVLDSSNRVVSSKLQEKTRELSVAKKDLIKVSIELEKKPKIITDTVEKIIYIESKKNFWGTTKTDTITIQ